MRFFDAQSATFRDRRLFGADGMRYLANATISAGTPLPSTPPARAAEAVLDDASELSPTRVAKHLTLGTDPGNALVDNLRAGLAEARAAGRPFVVSAARHSMGARCLAADGTVITLEQVQPDGVLTTCFRDENPDQFSMALGG